MSNREELLGSKARELESELGDWALDNNVLQPGEILRFEIKIVSEPSRGRVVLKRQEKLCEEDFRAARSIVERRFDKRDRHVKIIESLVAYYPRGVPGSNLLPNKNYLSHIDHLNLIFKEESLPYFIRLENLPLGSKIKTLYFIERV